MKKSEPILQIQNISKNFPNVRALDHVSMDVYKGEVIALCGENGAGKSTLMKILSAVYHPDKDGGQIIYQGNMVRYTTPMEAKNNGIVMIFQELSLVKQLTVAENIYLGSLPYKKGKGVDWKKLYHDTQSILEELGTNIQPNEIIGNLPISQQQLVEIARAISLHAKILILDEPTSSLTDIEKEKLFGIVNLLKQQGVAIIYISHKMDEILEISDRIVVFRDGRNVGELITSQATADQVVELMIGRNLEQYYTKKKTNTIGEEVLRVENLTINRLFNNISFSVRQGEILGLYGLVGAGRTEIMETIFGIRRANSGNIYMNGKKERITTSKKAVRLGMALVPENRKEQGLVLGMSCEDNIALSNLPEICDGILVNRKNIRNLYEKYKEIMSISVANPEVPVHTLSGGNQQKVVLAKWIATQPKLLILDEPTRGIDVGSKAEIHRMITEFADQGMAVIIISSEMPEIIGVSTRLLVIRNGELRGELAEGEINEKNIMEAIAL